MGRPGLNVASALPVGARAAAPAALLAGQLIKRGIEAADELEFLPWLDFLSALPPTRVLALKDVLARWLRWLCLRGFFGSLFVYLLAIFFFTSGWLLSDSSSVISVFSASLRACSNRSSMLCRLI